MNCGATPEIRLEGEHKIVRTGCSSLFHTLIKLLVVIAILLAMLPQVSRTYKTGFNYVVPPAKNFACKT